MINKAAYDELLREILKSVSIKALRKKPKSKRIPLPKIRRAEHRELLVAEKKSRKLFETYEASTTQAQIPETESVPALEATKPIETILDSNQAITAKQISDYFPKLKKEISDEDLSILRENLIACKENFTAGQITNCLQSLKKIRDRADYSKIRNELYRRLESSTGFFSSGMLAVLLHNFQAHTKNIDLKNFFNWLENQTNNLSKSEPQESLNRLLRHICLFHYEGNQTIPNFRKIKEHIQSLQDPNWLHCDSSNSESEESCRALIKAALGQGVPIESSIFIDGIQIDHYLPELKINIEIDGFEHDRAIKHDQQRDNYLRDVHGIRTVRIPKSDSDQEIIDSIRKANFI